MAQEKSLHRGCHFPSSSVRPGFSTAASESSRTPRASSNEEILLPGAPDEDDFNDDLDETIMAVDLKDSGTIGCAYFTTRHRRLEILEHIGLGDVETAGSLVLQIQPTTILAPGRASEALVRSLEDRAQATPPDGDGAPFILRFLATADFAAETARDRLIKIMDQLVPGAAAPSIAKLRLAACANVENTCSIGCAGAVLGDLSRRQSSPYMASRQMSLAFAVGAISVFSLAKRMLVNSDTLASLQILRSESHPSGRAGGIGAGVYGAKESLSIYGLFHQLAHTPQGRSQLKKVFLCPSTDIDLIKKRQATISLLLQPGYGGVLDAFCRLLRGLRDVRTSIIQIQRGIESPPGKIPIDRSVWAALRRFAARVLKLRESALALQDSRLPLFQNLLRATSDPGVSTVGDLITRTIDFNKSKLFARPVVASGVDSRLDSFNRQYDGIESLLTEASRQLCQELPQEVRVFFRGCIFLPQLGFLTRLSCDVDISRFDFENDWERKFVSEDTVCYKNEQMSALDCSFGDLYTMIIDREVEIIHSLGMQVLQQETILGDASDMCGELDCTVALALGARRYGWSKPTMTLANVIHIRGGRHPLQELVVPSYIPNDCFIEGGAGVGAKLSAPDKDKPQGSKVATVVITGPNHSGKSVFLKQVALVVFLAHVGSFVPADHAVVGLTDKILTRISTRETVASAESAFGTDLRQVLFAIKSASRRSLVLVDEFGKGTNAQDGAGLLAALLHHFSSLGPEMPRVLTATHFHEVFDCPGLLTPPPKTRFFHMDVKSLCRADLDGSGDELTPLFRLAEGRCGLSFGIRCAASNGVDEAAVERAASIAQLLSRSEDVVVVCERLSEEDEMRLEAAERTARRFMLLDDAQFASIAGSHGPSVSNGSEALADLIDRLLSA